MSAIGIDFGTTNTVLAFPDAKAGAVAQSFSHGNQTHDAMRTALSFRRNRLAGGTPVCEVGPWAIEEFLESPEDTRFLQSFKSFAASASFTDTLVFSRRYRFEDLLSTFLERVRGHTGHREFPQRAVVGRPVTFAGSNADDVLATRRYDIAFRQLGFREVHYVLEPVAAAHFYAQGLSQDATILVGDFGGGTSDFSIVRFKVSSRGISAEALGHSGIGIAGDSFDYRIIDNVVSPRLGKQATYRSWGKVLPIPVHYFSSFSRWNELCLMNRPDVIRALKDYARSSDHRDQLLSLVELIEGGVSYELYRTVSQVKAELSHAEQARFVFRSSGVAIDTTIRRSDFQKWIAADLSRIGNCVDEVLQKTGITETGIDRVFLTGGTSFVPAVRELFERRFPADRIDTGDQLLSIAKGLALISAGGDIEKWAVQGGRS